MIRKKCFDCTVTGNGFAGKNYALEVTTQGIVALITKPEPHESNINYA